MSQPNVVSNMYLRRLFRLLSGSNPLELTYEEIFGRDHYPLLHLLSRIPIVSYDNIFNCTTQNNCKPRKLDSSQTISHRNTIRKIKQNPFQKMLIAYIDS
ncbi:unnamed protein product [Heterobilharzia americana]|nr:unnamed protein product [Heterobilharzia americana]CAH8570828.1 unnamed protein product [Heterobilharzia americana]